MGWTGIGFLAGLGIVYAVAFRVAGSIFALWPLLSPLGSLFNQLEAGDTVLPLESILGFADVFGLMGAAIWLARRHERGNASGATAPALRGHTPLSSRLQRERYSTSFKTSCGVRRAPPGDPPIQLRRPAAGRRAA